MIYSDVISFWFEEIESTSWWAKDEAFDQLIRDRFADVHRKAAACELYEWREQPAGRLAEIIVLDQFSRNMFRDAPQAYAQDALALALAQEAVSSGAHSALSPDQRNFLYMPYMHSESRRVHEIALMLFRDNGVESTFDYEKKHKSIVDRFGRYPHRNELMGRLSTPEEMEFLSTPGSSF